MENNFLISIFIPTSQIVAVEGQSPWDFDWVVSEILSRMHCRTDRKTYTFYHNSSFVTLLSCMRVKWQLYMRIPEAILLIFHREEPTRGIETVKSVQTTWWSLLLPHWQSRCAYPSPKPIYIFKMGDWKAQSRQTLVMKTFIRALLKSDFEIVPHVTHPFLKSCRTAKRRDPSRDETLFISNNQ